MSKSGSLSFSISLFVFFSTVLGLNPRLNNFSSLRFSNSFLVQISSNLPLFIYKNLSSGQKQKVAIASSLILQPKILILDEPTSNLDIQGSKVLIEIIKKIKDKGISVVISEHRLDSFKEVADSSSIFFESRSLIPINSETS